MKLYNTLTHKKEKFIPQKENMATLYTCGPTVYDYAHIGNIRTYIFEDVLKRTLILAGFSVKHIMNITDVDDKTIKKSHSKKDELKKNSKKFEQAFIGDIKKLDILLPDKFTRATEYIDKMIQMINILLKKGYAYKTNDGSVYFSIAKFKDYGKLSRLDKEGIKSGARVNQDEYDKENPADFVLWKAWSRDDGDIYWEPSAPVSDSEQVSNGAGTSIGRGRPGWHIECSAMSGAELGDTVDIHAGAVDLIFPHHENEIAQSEGATGKKFVRFWIHGEHLLVNGKKMAKSKNNFFILADIEKRGFSPLDFRYLCLGAHYRSKLNFTWQGLKGAKNARERLVNIIDQNTNHKTQNTNKLTKNKYQDEFKKKIFDDLDLPAGLAVIWEMMRDKNITNEEKISNIKKFDQVLGLELLKKSNIEIPAEIEQSAEKRDQARRDKDYKLADEIRLKIEKKGYQIEDLKDSHKTYRIIKK